MVRRPWGDCLRWDGRPKRQLTEAEAARTVERVNVENRLRHHQPVDAYRCPTCGWWHTGKQRQAVARKRTEILLVELGERAWWCLMAENIDPDPQRRANTIRDRFRRILRDRACT